MAVAYAILGAITAARVAFVFVSPLNLDYEEAQYWVWAQSPAWGYFSKPPMIAWIIAAATQLCGDGEGCVRLASPLLHGATALVLGLVGREIGGPRLPFWTIVAYATLPGVSFSSVLMTTDVPLLLFWSLALWCFVRWLRTGGIAWAGLCGVAVGCGMLSKYSMALFVGGMALAWLLCPAARPRMRPRAWLAFAVMAALPTIPNIAWNIDHGFATARHTAWLAGIGRDLGNPLGLVNFLAAQFVVFGPIPFWLLARRFLVRVPAGSEEDHRLLWAFCVPILWAFLVEAAASEAYPNWSAPAYAAGLVLVASWLLRQGREGWLRASTWLHLAGAAVLYLMLAAVPSVSVPWRGTVPVTARLHGWDELGRDVASRLAGQPPTLLLLAEDRKLLGLLSYYAHVPPARLVAWNPDGVADNHFELVSHLAPGAAGPYLLVSAYPDPGWITSRFERSRSLGSVRVGVAGDIAREHWLHELWGFKGY